MKWIPAWPPERWFPKCVSQCLRDESGSYILETAIALPIFLTMTFLFIGTSLVLFVYGNITYGAQAAVRYASVRSLTSQTPCTIAQIQQSALSAMLTAGGGTITVLPTWSPDNNVGSAITVAVSVNYPVVLPFLDTNSFTLASSSTGTITY
jgi:Flp pilus assembly protein TadG